MEKYFSEDVRCFSCQNLKECGDAIKNCPNYYKINNWSIEQTLMEITNLLYDRRKQIDDKYAKVESGTSEEARFLQGKLMGIDEARIVISHFIGREF